MSRGYNNWNRTFVAKEPGLSPIPPEREDGSHWHRADVMRLRFHPAFRLPQDGPCNSNNSLAPTLIPVDHEHIQIVAPSGLSMVELSVDGQYRTHIEYLQMQPNRTTLSYNDICSRCKCDSSQRISLQVTCTNQSEHAIDNLSQFLQEHVFRLPGIEGPVIKHNTLGSQSEGETKSSVIFGNRQLVRIVVNHGCFLDGFTLVWDDGSKYQMGGLNGDQSLFDVYPGEHIHSLLVRSGAWIDGIQFKLSSGRFSPWFGGTGGDLHVVEPAEGHRIIGIFGSANDWMEQIGIFSASAQR
ncbi:Jacalin-like lectin domain-containing protein [Blakeslea trispora]|nr:Jacalin-like lectin domain-containing protein [Blakeslea trispora]